MLPMMASLLKTLFLGEGGSMALNQQPDSIKKIRLKAFNVRRFMIQDRAVAGGAHKFYDHEQKNFRIFKGFGRAFKDFINIIKIHIRIIAGGDQFIFENPPA